MDDTTLLHPCAWFDKGNLLVPAAPLFLFLYLQLVLRLCLSKIIFLDSSDRWHYYLLGLPKLNQRAIEQGRASKRLSNSTNSLHLYSSWKLFHIMAALIQTIAVVDKSGKAVSTVSVQSLPPYDYLANTCTTEQASCQRLQRGQSRLPRTKSRSCRWPTPQNGRETASQDSKSSHPGRR